MRVTPAASGQWLLVLETLQAEQLITVPIRLAALVDADVLQIYQAPAGWTLIDAVGHPSGNVSLLSLRMESAGYPLRALISRVGRDGTRTDLELARLPPPSGPEPQPQFPGSLDRARLVAHGEDLFAVVRWANNGVQAYALEGLQQRWASWVEAPAPLFIVGIIGGGFDNFRQGDGEFFVHADADAAGNLFVGVASTEDVVRSHDAFFGENLGAQTDPASFDFDTAIVTRLAADGGRSYARLLGHPGRNRQILSLRAAGDSFVVLGRLKTGQEPGSWDGWIAKARAATGEIEFDKTLDVQQGDMFWDAAPLSDGRFVAVGSTNYTQNPSGLSVSDARDALALVLDASGNVQKRIAMPGGPRGNEAMSVSAARGEVAISGVQNAPGTHAEVFSDAFAVIQSL